MTPGLVCKHVVREQAIVRMVSHQQPEDPDDSGLSAACWSEHAIEDWLVEDVSEYVPVELLDLAEGHVAVRGGAGEPWVIEPLPAEQAA